MSLDATKSKDNTYQGEVLEIVVRVWGRFVVTQTQSGGQVSFTLNPSIWDGGDDPLTGETVALSRLRFVRGRWRALQANRIKP